MGVEAFPLDLKRFKVIMGVMDSFTRQGGHEYQFKGDLRSFFMT